VVCTDDISRNVVFRNDIELHLKAGIEATLCCYYLPEVDLCTGAILGVEALAIAFATSVAVYDPALVPNLSTNISCVAAAWALIDDHGPPDRTRRSHGAGRRTIPDDSRGISAVNRFVLMV
jgi:hypothetical protein